MQSIGSSPLSVLSASPHGHIAQANRQQAVPSPSPSVTSSSTTVEHGMSHLNQQQQQQQPQQQSPQLQYQATSANGSAHKSSSLTSNTIISNHHQQYQDQQQNGSFTQKQIQNGLLSLADHEHSTPKHGHVRLESEQLIFSNINSLNNLETSDKLSHLLNDITSSAAAVLRAASCTSSKSSSSGSSCASSLSSSNNVNVTSNATATSNNHVAKPSSSSTTTSTTTNSSFISPHQQHLHNHNSPIQPSNHQRLHFHHQNGHSTTASNFRRPSPPEPMDLSPEDTPGAANRYHLRIGEEEFSTTSALDKLLATLTLERNVNEQHLAKIDHQQRNGNDLHQSHVTELCAVIANLTEYNLSESAQQRLNGNELNYQQPVDHLDYNGNGFQHHHHAPERIGAITNHQQIRRIASESDSTISSVSPSLSERSNGVISWCDQAREESFSSYRSETEPDNSPTGGSPRPETPAFPVTPRTPYGLANGTSSPALPPKSPTSQRKYNSTWSLRSQKSTVSTYDLSKDLFSGNRQEIINQNETVSCYTSRRNSTTSNANSEPQEVAPQFVKFARDSSKYWYKPGITREEAITLLRNAPPGTFVVRDSTTFANAYGLVVKVTHPPPGVASKGPNSDELVRHFLVEPTIRGVRLKGCANEPVFTSLSALVYQHSITPLALPCRLIIPDMDLQQTEFTSPAQQQLLSQGAACNVLYLFTCDTESLTGPQAIRKAVGSLLSLRPLPKPTQVHFKVSIQGITLTDNTRQLFFRRHYASNNVSFCGLDPDEHRWSIPSSTGDIPASKRIFAFVAKRSPTSADNQCHVFCELENTQPASAIVAFANKVVLGTAASQQPAVTRAI
ncbi:tensin-1 [Uranotaenia lowii]|uniref:tensin-1 n=1 Tax=Uranotaenia lowii TaxID=190385 RepID=UPI002479C495|nr:tensin-1 [Uranotaenia lowii]